METQRPRVALVGGVAWNTMVYLHRALASAQGSGPAAGWQQALGSTGAGKALNMQRLGFEVHLHSLLGSDVAAGKIRTQLEGAGIACHWHPYVGASEQHVNLMSPGGERQSLFLEQEPDVDNVALDWFAAVWPQADYHWVNIKPYCRRLLPALVALGKPLWCDLHDYDDANPFHQPFIAAADYLIVSAENLDDPEDFMARQIDAGKQLVIVTDGSAGLRAMDAAGQRYCMEVVPGIEVIDSNGAGDAFSAGFLFGWQRQFSLEKCLQLGACAGAICVGSPQLASSSLDETRLLEGWRRYYG